MNDQLPTDDELLAMADAVAPRAYAPYSNFHVGCAVLAGTACFNGLFFSHMPAYLAGVLKYDPRQAIYSQTVGVIANAMGILATGWLADRVPPFKGIPQHQRHAAFRGAVRPISRPIYP